MALLAHSFLIEDKDRTAAPLGVVPAEGGPGGASEEAMQPPGVAVPASGGTSGVPGAGGVQGLPLGLAGASGDAGAPLDPTGAVGTTVAPPGQASAAGSAGAPLGLAGAASTAGWDSMSPRPLALRDL